MNLDLLSEQLHTLAYNVTNDSDVDPVAMQSILSRLDNLTSFVDYLLTASTVSAPVSPTLFDSHD